jgi:hypothetical protein
VFFCLPYFGKFLSWGLMASDPPVALPLHLGQEDSVHVAVSFGTKTTAVFHVSDFLSAVLSSGYL